MKTTIKSTMIGLVTGAAFVITGEFAQAESTFQAENMFKFGDPGELKAGAATLTRTEEGISFRIYTSGLKRGAHTTWIVIFNNPDECAGGAGNCAGSDLNVDSVAGSIVYGAGYIVGPHGIANFSGHLAEGDPPAGIEVDVPAGTARGLSDAKEAEIHFVVRDHGKTDKNGGAVIQLTTFEDDCDECDDVQAVIFAPLAN